MLLIILYSITNQLMTKNHKVNATPKVADLSLIIKGMTCNHCKQTATEAIEACNGTQDDQKRVF